MYKQRYSYKEDQEQETEGEKIRRMLLTLKTENKQEVKAYGQPLEAQYEQKNFQSSRMNQLSCFFNFKNNNAAFKKIFKMV